MDSTKKFKMSYKNNWWEKLENKIIFLFQVSLLSGKQETAFIGNRTETVYETISVGLAVASFLQFNTPNAINM